MSIPKESFVFPLHEIEFDFSRSSGPGGQNVNKVNTKATLRWRPLKSHFLPQVVKERFLSAHSAKLTTEGELVISSDRYRSQLQNKEDCLKKLAVLFEPLFSPPKRRKKSKTPKSQKQKRLNSKKQRGEVKKIRSKVKWQNDY